MKPEVREPDLSVHGKTVVASSGLSTRADRNSPPSDRLTSTWAF